MPELTVKTREGTYHGDHIISEHGELLLRIEGYGTVNAFELEDVIFIRRYDPD